DAGISKYLTEIVENVNIPEVKAAAALALSKIGSSPEALQTLRKALQDRNRYFKMSAIVALGYFRDQGTVKDFMQLYKRESNYEVRALSVVALGYIGEDAPVPVLRQISMDFNHLSVFQKQMDAMNIILGLF
ncbi:MAG: HEAT repeat domain-containing protein, partial [Planctomycetota bacterium]